MKNKIICIGNRLIENDRAGLLVYDLLAAQKMPPHTQLIEGGISGLNLLCFLENAGTVVFVDTVAGFTTPGGVVVLNTMQIKSACPEPHYGHDAGIPYVLEVLPGVCDTPLPREIFLVGLEGPVRESAIKHAAKLSLSLIDKCGLAHKC